MDRDDFIITVYCLVCEHYQAIKAAYPLRRGGFAPALTDEEVIRAYSGVRGGLRKQAFEALIGPGQA
jgi:hypothetical protein